MSVLENFKFSKSPPTHLEQLLPKPELETNQHCHVEKKVELFSVFSRERISSKQQLQQRWGLCHSVTSHGGKREGTKNAQNHQLRLVGLKLKKQHLH